MFKKILLFTFGLLCISNTQAASYDWSINTESKLAYTALAFAGVSAGSYTMYKVICLAIDTLERDKRISSVTSAKLKNIVGARMTLLPLYVLYFYYKKPNEITTCFNAFEAFLGSFSYGARLIGPEIIIWQEALKFFSSKH